jgi:hypothetical protein
MIYTLMGIKCCDTLISMGKEINASFGKIIKLKWMTPRI